MKTLIKHFATAMLLLLAVSVAQARPIAISGVNPSGNFSVDAQANTLTLTGNIINLTTSAATGDIASGSARFMSGELKYNDGTSQLDGQMAKVSFGSKIDAGKIVYVLKGLVYGKLTQDGQTVDVNGSFSVLTKSAPETTKINEAQLEATNLMLTIRSNINNTEPASVQQPKRTHTQ